jgi:hypothetical protein
MNLDENVKMYKITRSGGKVIRNEEGMKKDKIKEDSKHNGKKNEGKSEGICNVVIKIIKIKRQNSEVHGPWQNDELIKQQRGLWRQNSLG